MLKQSFAFAVFASALAVPAVAQSSSNITYSANATESVQRNLVQPIRPGDSTQSYEFDSNAYHEALTLLQKRKYPQAYEGLFTLAREGDGRAMRTIGWMYANGLGFAADSAKALGWFQEAALAGDAHAQLIFGTALARGLNIDRDTDAARYWLERARESGEPRIAGSAADELRRL